MYSPYGSYSSMSSTTQPLDIAPSSYLSRDSTYYSSCAFPSWPQRSSLMDSEVEERATSYLSDDDLFPCDSSSDDAQSISSGSSTASTSPYVSDQELLAMQELQRQKLAALQREALKQLLNEKERRRQQGKRSRRVNMPKKSSPKAKDAAAMAPISE